MAVTTIQLDAQVRRALDGLKLHRRDTCNDVVERLLAEPRELGSNTLKEIEVARAEIRAGKYLTNDQV